MAPGPADAGTADSLTRHIDPPGDDPEGLPPSLQLGRFTLEKRLGAGGMGVVYTAHDPKLGRRVAVKLLHGSAARAGPERLLREAQAMARLAHPNVVVIYDVGLVDDQVFLAMELVEGTTLGAWLKERERPWPEVLEMFLQAGRGLAAAHAAGIIHRDFKPANVLVGRDGRARVTDFGLARDDRDDSADGPPVLSPEMDRTSQTLTRQGAVLGTPAYMAPEQRRGERLTRRADQYSFCVALHEGLAGVRPTSTRSVRRPIPTGLRRVLERGLAADPERRFPSMDALLAALEHGSRRRQRVVVTAAATVAVLAATGLVWATRVSPPPRCDAGARLGGVWDDARKTQMRAAFLATGLPYAERQWQGVERSIDAYAAGWTKKANALCEATPKLAPAVAQGRAACLGQLLENLRSWGGLFDSADAALVKNAVDSAGNRDDLAECDELDDAPTPRPQDPVLGAEVVSLRAQLSAAESQSRAGDYQPAVATLRRLTETARALGYRPLVAEALVGLASALNKRDDWKESIALLLEAREIAEELRYDRARIGAQVTLAYVDSNTAKYEDAHVANRLAIAMLKPMTGVFARVERARIDVMEGFAYWGDHQLVRALQLFERGLADAGPTWGAVSANTASVLSAQGSVLLELENLDQAEDRFRRARDILLALTGDSHPTLGAIANNLGSVRYHRHDYAGAAAWYRESLAVKERAGLGPGNLARAYSLINLGECLYQLGQIDEAAATLGEARSIFVAKLGPTNELMGELETFEGLIALARGAPAAAVTTLEDALARRQAIQAPPGDRADTELALARALQASGRERERARGLGEQARVDYVSAGKKDDALAAAAWLEKPARP